MPIFNINSNTTFQDVLTNDPSTGNIPIESPDGQTKLHVIDDEFIAENDGALITISDFALAGTKYYQLKPGTGEHKFVGPVPMTFNGLYIATESYADAKVAQTITDGVTTSAPSQDAVFGALALKQNSLGYTPENAANKVSTISASAIEYPNNNAVIAYAVPLTTGVRILHQNVIDSTSVTGTVNNTISYSVLIPANTFTPGSTMRISVRGKFTGTTSTKTVRIYFHTLNQIAGATLCATIANASGILSMDASRMGAIKSATDTEFYNATTSSAAGDAPIGAAVTSNNIDWTVDQYFIIAIQLGSAADAGLISYSRITN